MTRQLQTPGTRRSPAKSWPSVALASARLCRPHLHVVDPEPEIQLETAAVLELAAISVDGELVAVDGSLHADAAGTSLEIGGDTIRIRDAGSFSAAFELRGRRALVVTVTIPLDLVARGQVEPVLREPA